MKNKDRIDESPWEDYVEALLMDFGERIYEDPWQT